MSQDRSKSIARFIAACESGLVTEGQISGIRKTLNWHATAAQTDAILEAVQKHGGPKVTPGQMEKGRAALLRASLKKNGTLRKNSPLTMDQVHTVKTAQWASLFNLEDMNQMTHGRAQWYPVYQYTSMQARYSTFTYIACSWQSGLAPIQAYWR